MYMYVNILLAIYCSDLLRRQEELRKLEEHHKMEMQRRMQQRLTIGLLLIHYWQLKIMRLRPFR